MSVSEATRKTAADQLAEFIASGEGNVTDVLEKMKAFKTDNGNIPQQLRNDNAGKYIGIWKEDEQGTSYIRDRQLMPEWVKWAGLNKIPVSTNKERLLLTGESVGRGSFYGNEYSPAIILQHILNSVAGHQGSEITDLAKSGMTPGEMLSLLENAQALKPSQVVIMAGNNFFYGLYDDFIHGSLPEPLAAGELSGRRLKAWIDEALDHQVHVLLQELHRMFVTAGIPVTFVIPAFNLAGWKVTQQESCTPALSGEDLLRWEQLLETARDAQAQGDHESLKKAAEALLALDASHPASYECLGEAALLQHQWTAARQYLETARDHTLLFRSVGKPRILSSVRNAILKYAPQYHIDTIDLNTLLAANAKNGIPGHDFFMDYCHMNMKGIRLCMVAVAVTILHQRGLQHISLDMLHSYAAEIAPPRDVNCMAHIYAAIHHAHNGQGNDNIMFHLKQAFSFSRELATVFCKSYITMVTYRLSSPLTREFMKILENTATCIEYYPEAAFHPRSGKLLDLALTDAMSNMLVEAGAIEPAATAALRLSEHAVELHRVVDLLEPAYSRSSYDNYPFPSNYYTARDIRSSFIFFTDARQSLHGEMICRCKHANNGALQLSVNGRSLLTQPLSKRWIPLSFTIDQSLLTTGMNRIDIIWEQQSIDSTDQIAENISDVITLLNPIRAEIHRFTISI
ncbi:hypothetical protein [Chitinophaga qingshengii]|uniref:SGNH/GDSL hydrolase family protein n=1 Tax=Chitinophaga qingshengii TaxID=1569794 RepID=A0ABR7TVN4_9BACT|nr:hypothetical protein [Chitinophaga qingshengii]MBC9934523.1 hypothetical protein [Chitinophaga qingshengii]